MEQVLCVVKPYKVNLAKEVIFNIVIGLFAVGFLTLGILAMALYQSWVRGIMFTLFFPILLYIMIKELLSNAKTKKWMNNNIDKPQVVIMNNKKVRFYGLVTMDIELRSVYQVGYDKNSVTILLNYYNPKTHNGSPKSYTFNNITDPYNVANEISKYIKNKENIDKKV